LLTCKYRRPGSAFLKVHSIVVANLTFVLDGMPTLIDLILCVAMMHFTYRFPETTVMFLDISGFTAWSSVREPVQVFTLLETLYRSFDDIAAKRKVFKVSSSCRYSCCRM
jgi:Adenylate and Guanylate cyclase catalytic domain